VLGMFGAEATYNSRCAPLITRLNRGLFKRGIEERFLTAFYGMLGADGSLTYSNAGHNAPVLLMRHGVRRLETGGTILGLFPQASYEEETVELESGDVLVIFSDGVTEALNGAGEEFGEERLLSCLDANRRRPPVELLDCVFSAVRAFAGNAAQNDDVTAMVLKFTAPTPA